jgi:hypothetical protein
MLEATTNMSGCIEDLDFTGLITFLVCPFLEQPGDLRVDCEVSPSKNKVWVRLAFPASDKGRVFGRGGRNIQAIRAVLSAAAQAVGYTAYLDIYGNPANSRDWEEESELNPPKKAPVRRTSSRESNSHSN